MFFYLFIDNLKFNIILEFYILILKIIYYNLL